MKRVKSQLTGLRFAQLVVLEAVDKDRHGKWRWLCRCDCGIEKVFVGRDLKKTQSCGCLVKERSPRLMGLASNAETYFTGKPCKYGHFSSRRVTGGACVECERLRTAERLENSVRYGTFERGKDDPKKRLLDHARHRAKARGIEYSLRAEDVTMPTHCPCCQCELAFNKQKTKNNSYTLDRLILQELMFPETWRLSAIAAIRLRETRPQTKSK